MTATETGQIDQDQVDYWVLTPADLAATREKLAKINQRATKRGFTGRIDIDAEKTTRVTNTPSGLRVEEVVYHVRITGTPPSYGGWSLIATIDFDPHAGLIVRTAPGVKSVNRDQIREGWCDHCASQRHRKNTHLVRHADGTQKQVGSTCIKDFLGWEAGPVRIFTTEELEKEIGFGSMGGGPRAYTVDTVLAAAWAVIKHDGGYVRSGDMGATIGKVIPMIDPARHQEAREKARAFRPHIEAARDMGATIREFILSEDFGGDSEYVLNLKSIAAADQVSGHNLGLLVSAPQAWARHQEKTLIKQRERAEIRNEHVGEVGDKIELEVKIKNVGWTSNRYGTTTIYTLVSRAGHIFKWFASREALGDKPADDFVRIKGLIKEHEEWKGTLSTVLTRCKKLS